MGKIKGDCAEYRGFFFLIHLPIQDEQQNQSRQVRRRNVGFLLEAEEDHDHNQAGDDVVALSKQTR